jgi:hypothetical protein
MFGEAVQNSLLCAIRIVRLRHLKVDFEIILGGWP